MDSPITDKVILITGASSSIGKALALSLATDKPKLVLLSRSAEKLQDVVQSISATGTVVSCFSCNVTDIQQIKNAVDYVLEAYDSIDILINCAAIWSGDAVDYQTEQKVREMFDVNTIGLISMCKEVISIMQSANSGHILNISSTAAFEGSSGKGVYAATKFAVRGFIESLRVELRDTKIKISTIYAQNLDAELFNTTIYHQAQDIHPQVLEIAQVVTFMLRQSGDLTLEQVVVKKGS